VLRRDPRKGGIIPASLLSRDLLPVSGALNVLSAYQKKCRNFEAAPGYFRSDVFWAREA